MAKYNDDDFNDGEFGDDFFGRWEEFNRMMNDRQFRRSLNQWQRDLEELMRRINENNGEGTPLKFQFINLTPRSNDLNIPDDDMNIEKGEDENGEWENKSWTSPDGSISFNSFTRSSSFDDLNPNAEDLFADMFFSKTRRNEPKLSPEEIKEFKINKLKKSLESLVAEEKYERAAEVKKMIEDLEKPSSAATEE